MAEHDGSAAGLNTAARWSLVVGVVALIALGVLAGTLGYTMLDERRAGAQQDVFVDVARQGAINLTTIDHSTADADIQRILDGSTGTFHDDFQKRAQPFTDVVKQAQSTSVGTVTSAALESRDGDKAQVLVLMSVQMSSPADTAEQQPQAWRMRIGVQQTGDAAKVSDVEFVQ